MCGFPQLLLTPRRMPIENSQTIVKTKAGRPNHAKLHAEGRLPVAISKDGSPFDPNPAPKVLIQGHSVSRGYARGPDGIWRVGLDPQSYHDMVELSAKRKELSKDWDFLPQLHDEEIASYNKWLADKEKKVKKD